jgi:drug/metabolite transporter (DMT)-like permease
LNRPAFVFPLTLLVTVLWAAGQTLMKRAVNAVPSGSAPLALTAIVFTDGGFWMGILVTAVGTIAWLIILSRADLSYAAPFSGVSTTLLIMVSSIVFLREPVSALRIAGTLVTAIGIALVAKS